MLSLLHRTVSLQILVFITFEYNTADLILYLVSIVQPSCYSSMIRSRGDGILNVVKNW